MKHFFVVTSNITYLIACQIIKTEQLDYDDCALLCDRNFKPKSVNISFINISDFRINSIKLSRWNEIARNYFQNLSDLKELDQKLDTLLKNAATYALYLPHGNDFKYHALLSNPNCSDLYYFEEGRMSYAWKDHLYSSRSFFPRLSILFKRSILYLIHSFYLRGRAPAFPEVYNIHHKKYRGAFTLSEWSLEGFPNKKILQLPFEVRPELKKYDPVLIFGPHVELKEIKLNTLKTVLPKVLEYFISQKLTKLYIKFHPTQYDRNQTIDPINKILDQFADKIEFELIPADISLENIAITTKGSFYTAVSSAGLYATLCGAQIYSFAKSYLKYSPEFQIVMDTIPDVYLKQIQFLEIDI